MELNITRFFNEACPMDYSASVAEIGQNAGKATWQAACEDSSDYMILDSQEKREAFRAYVKGFGAWEETEIQAWNDIELNALLLQFIAGDIRERQHYIDQNRLAEYEENIGGRLWVNEDGTASYLIYE